MAALFHVTVYPAVAHQTRKLPSPDAIATVRSDSLIAHLYVRTAAHRRKHCWKESRKSERKRVLTFESVATMLGDYKNRKCVSSGLVRYAHLSFPFVNPSQALTLTLRQEHKQKKPNPGCQIAAKQPFAKSWAGHNIFKSKIAACDVNPSYPHQSGSCRASVTSNMRLRDRSALHSRDSDRSPLTSTSRCAKVT